MRALLLAAGLGSRLGHVTRHTPKCLVRIKGVPLLDIWVTRLAAAGFTEVLVNTHHLASTVEDHIRASRYEIAVHTHFEPELLGTAGTIALHSKWLGTSDALVGHADNYSLFRIDDFLSAHRRRPIGVHLTMLAFRTDTPWSCGVLQVDDAGILQNMWEKSLDDHGNLANAAVYVVTSEVIALTRGLSDFSTEVIPQLFGRTLVVETHETHIDIGMPESLERAQNL